MAELKEKKRREINLPLQGIAYPVQTKSKKAFINAVRVELPLYNNPAEFAARYWVHKRDISFRSRTEDGKRAWDTFMTLATTTKSWESVL